MLTATPISNKSPIASEIRESLIEKAAPGQPSLSRKVSRARWREYLGISNFKISRAATENLRAADEDQDV
jgi:hypothetical protein